jgi:hypothetical protein
MQRSPKDQKQYDAFFEKNVDRKQAQNEEALFNAVRTGDVSLVETLCEKSIDVNAYQKTDTKSTGYVCQPLLSFVLIGLREFMAKWELQNAMEDEHEIQFINHVKRYQSIATKLLDKGADADLPLLSNITISDTQISLYSQSPRALAVLLQDDIGVRFPKGELKDQIRHLLTLLIKADQRPTVDKLNVLNLPCYH